MKLNSDTPIARELSDHETREHTVESQIGSGYRFSYGL